MVNKKIKLALVSCGLGNVQRGFETSTARWHDALIAHGEIDVKLFCGGDYPQGIKVGNIPRDSKTMSLLRKMQIVHDGCRVEQFTFGLCFLRHILRWQPDVIWVQEYTLAKLLMTVRQRLRLGYKILFCNGAPAGPQEYQEFDFIQHLHGDSYQDGIYFGINPAKMHILPYCSPLPKMEKGARQARSHYGIAESAWVILCVAAFNRHHKRIDYLIKEVAALDDPDVILLLCGQPEADTPLLKKLGEDQLKNKVRWMTVSPDQVYELMSLSDVFVLPSLTEGLGAVLIEAALCRLPIICHPHSGGRAVVADGWPMPDLSQDGNLTSRLKELKHFPPDSSQIEKVYQQAVEHFSSPLLAPQFVAMVNRLMSSDATAAPFHIGEESAVAN